MSLAVLTGCSATERLWVERSEPARVDLPAGTERLAVASFEGDSGAALSEWIVAELERGAGPVPTRLDERPLSVQDALALLAKSKLPALLAGRVELIEPPASEGDPGRIRVRYHVVLKDGSVLSAPPLALTVLSEDRGEASWESALLQLLARDLVQGLRPRTVRVMVEWELADGWDENAWERFASKDYTQCAELLKTAIRKAQDDVDTDGETLGALYYDLALCQELLGDLSAAERNYDEALTLSGRELHITALRALRGRMERAGGGR